ncbi:hypothetical protein EJA70_07005 [Pseudomonas sp. PB103]|uniref:hypothetical protein n=1 Tax=Pseudomonas sp. PB103 TaxID=2494698 RepID=UPI00131C1DEE|nr:hypothetical protein [Pseudomonas sp. PB103]KAE9646900.1 hypothetical protein EJA70_07005 [Pseudomonas sp. PB103]
MSKAVKYSKPRTYSFCNRTLPRFGVGGEVNGSFDQRLHFYIPKKYWLAGVHPINLDKDTEAYYNDQFGKTWTTQPGGELTILQIDLAMETVIIEFKFVTKKDVDDWDCLALTGSGRFEGFTTDPSHGSATHLQTLRTAKSPA